MAFNPDQPRDENGQWTDGGSAIKSAASSYKPPVVHNPEEAAAELERLKNEQIINDNHLAAVYEYTGAAFRDINSSLREGGLPASEEDRQTIEELDEFLKVAPKFEGETYRGIRFKNPDNFQHFIDDVNDDSVIVDFAFGSTSIKESVSDEYANKDISPYKIKMVVKGHSGVYLEPITSAAGENEVLFPRMTKFKVNSIKIEDGDGVTVIKKAIINVEEL